MLIKPGKYAVITTMGILLFVVATMIYIAIIDNNWLYLLVLCVFIPLYMPMIIASCRILFMDKDGCTVYFLWFKKHYRWDELKIKQYVEYKGYFMASSVSPFKRAAEFCPKDVSIPKRWDAHVYSQRRHPFSFFFVSFADRTSQGSKKRFSGAYEVDETMFREKLKEWGVEMKEITRGDDC